MFGRLRQGVRAVAAATLAVVLLVVGTPVGASASPEDGIATQDRWNNCLGCVSLAWRWTALPSTMSQLVASNGAYLTNIGPSVEVVPFGLILPDPLIDHHFAITYTCAQYDASTDFDSFGELLPGHLPSSYTTDGIWGQVHSSAYWAFNSSESYQIPCGNSQGDQRLVYLALIERNWNSSFNNEPSGLHVVLSVGTAGDCPYSGNYRKCITDGGSFGSNPYYGSLDVVGFGTDGNCAHGITQHVGPAGAQVCGEYVDLRYDVTHCEPHWTSNSDAGFYNAGYGFVVMDLVPLSPGNPNFQSAFRNYELGFTRINDMQIQEPDSHPSTGGAHTLRQFLGHYDPWKPLEDGVLQGGLSVAHTFRLLCMTETRVLPPADPFADPTSCHNNSIDNGTWYEPPMMPALDCLMVAATASSGGQAEYRADCGFDVHRPETWGDSAQCQAVVELKKANLSLRDIAVKLDNLNTITCTNCSGSGGGGSFTDPVNTAGCTGLSSVVCIFKSIADAIGGLASLFTTLFVPSASTFNALNGLSTTFTTHPPGSVVVGAVAGMNSAVLELSNSACADLPALDFGTSGGILSGTRVDYPSMCGNQGVASAPAFHAAYDLVRVALYGLLVFALWGMAARAFGSKE